MPDKKIHIKCSECSSRGDSLFKCLHAHDMGAMEDAKSCIKYKKGQTLFYEGTRPMGLYCINEGKVKVFKLSSQGKEQIVHLAKPGDFLGYR